MISTATVSIRSQFSTAANAAVKRRHAPTAGVGSSVIGAPGLQGCGRAGPRRQAPPRTTAYGSTRSRPVTGMRPFLLLDESLDLVDLRVDAVGPDLLGVGRDHRIDQRLELV